MLRLSVLFFCLVLLAGCDSDGDGPSDPPAASALLGVAVEDASGAPVSGLSLTMEYDLVSSNGDGGDRTLPPAVLRYFGVEALGDDRFRVEWETESEEAVARFVVEAGADEEAFGDVVEAEAQGPGQPYAVEVEGSFSAFRLRIEDTDGSVEYSEVRIVTAGDDPPAF